MTGRAQVTWLPDGRRLHLHHGPIDMIVGIEGAGRDAGFARAARRFETLLDELVAELPRLRRATGAPPRGETAGRMLRVTDPFKPAFITPMAAVAGAGADTILRAICGEGGVDKAYVNNGGDVAFHIGPGQTMRAVIAGDPLGLATLTHGDRVRGIATSGWRGRSLSLGIADSVTALAATAAQADAAATMIANRVNLPGHPAITRTPARDLSPDSELGERPVTTAVGTLTPKDVARALQAGVRYSETLVARGLIHAASLTLCGTTRTLGATHLMERKDPAHA